MKNYEVSARTIEEAISNGLEHLGVSISDVTVDILEDTKSVEVFINGREFSFSRWLD